MKVQVGFLCVSDEEGDSGFLWGCRHSVLSKPIFDLRDVVLHVHCRLCNAGGAVT